MALDRLKREGDPPSGQLASPKPQYKDVQTNNWEELKGEGGASYVKDRDVLAQLDLVKAELELVTAELQAIKTQQTDGSAKVTLSGTYPKLRGATLADRPSADCVPVGTSFTLINDNLDTWVSNGTKWVEV